MTILSDISQAWPQAIVDIGPIEISAGYCGVVGLIPYDGHVVLDVIPTPPGRRGDPHMTMFPNPEPHPTGVEPVEYIEAHHAAEPADRSVARIERRDVPTAHLDTQTRLNITRWAEEYITGFVENRHGDRHDLRAIIHDLHYQTNVADKSASA